MSKRSMAIYRPMAIILMAAMVTTKAWPLEALANTSPVVDGAAAAPQRSDSDALIQRVDVEQKLNAQLPLDLDFRDETGAHVRLNRYFDERPVILAMVYYECPMLCTLVLNGLVKSLRAVPFEAGRDFDILVVSIDPGETPQLAAAKKRSYLEQYDRGRSEGWHFLTGEQAQIKRLADTIGFGYVYDTKRDEYAHAAFLTVVTPAGRLSRYFFGIEYSSKDVRLALVDASQGRIGSLADRLLLLCYHYDPSTGQYSVATLNLMRAGGAVTVLALAGWILSRLRKERKA